MDKWERIPLTDEEIDRIIAECTTLEQQFLVMMLRYTGCRVNEVLRARKEWFIMEDDILWIRKKRDDEITHADHIKTKKKGAKTPVDRLIPLHPQLKIVAAAFFRKYDRLSKTRQWCYLTIRALGRAAGIDKNVSCHIFRHSYIDKIYRETDLKSKEIGVLAGHASGFMVEEVYTHITNREIVDRLKAQITPADSEPRLNEP